MPYPNDGKCSECQINFNDGYCIDCRHCQERRNKRLRRGVLRTPTQYTGEHIDNTTPNGRMVAPA